MTYCNVGVEAVIEYRFSGSAVKRYTTKQTPVEVVTSRISNSIEELIPGQDYQVRTIYTDPNTGQTFIQSVGASGQSLPILKAPVSRLEFQVTTDGTTSYLFLLMNDANNINARIQMGRLNGYSFNPIDLYKIYDILPFPTPEDPDSLPGKCKIEIKHNQKLLFSDVGSCPVKFAVACGEECPEGYLKCSSTNYPGYCCLQCEPLEKAIASLTTTVRGANKGAVSHG